MLKVVSILSAFRTPPQPAPVLDPIDGLLAERDKAMATLQRFGAFGARVEAAHDARKRAEEALRAFIAAETSTLREWAENGDGEAPSADIAKHAELVGVCETAAREYDAAVAARRIYRSGAHPGAGGARGGAEPRR